jgi:hypothetical protein
VSLCIFSSHIGRLPSPKIVDCRTVITGVLLFKVIQFPVPIYKWNCIQIETALHD